MEEQKKAVINENIGFKCSKEEIEYFNSKSKELVLNKSELFRLMVRTVQDLGVL